MFSPLRKVGNIAEKLTLKFLEKQSLRLIKKNYLTKVGEVDLIMFKDYTIVFIEVRYLFNNDFISNIASINYSKQRRIIKSAQLFLQQNPEYQDFICRFDVVGVKNSLKYPKFNWIKDAFIL